MGPTINCNSQKSIKLHNWVHVFDGRHIYGWKSVILDEQIKPISSCSGRFCSKSTFCISVRPFLLRKKWIWVHQFSPVKIMIFFWNCSLNKIVKYGLETQYWQRLGCIISQSLWPKVSKWLKLLRAHMLATIWTYKIL